MNSTSLPWETRLADLWAHLDSYEEARFVSAMLELTGELPQGHPVALFELGAVYDSTGSQQKAMQFYESSLAAMHRG